VLLSVVYVVPTNAFTLSLYAVRARRRAVKFARIPRAVAFAMQNNALKFRTDGKVRAVVTRSAVGFLFLPFLMVVMRRRWKNGNGEKFKSLSIKGVSIGTARIRFRPSMFSESSPLSRSSRRVINDASNFPTIISRLSQSRSARWPTILALCEKYGLIIDGCSDETVYS